MSEQNAVFAFECNIKGTDWQTIINARSAGKAKTSYWNDVRESWPSIPFTAVRCRKLGAPYSSNRFIDNAQYRGMPAVRCGQRVRVGKALGFIVGHNGSANFDVLFDDDAPEYRGLTLNVHPSEIQLVDAMDGKPAAGQPDSDLRVDVSPTARPAE